MTFRVDVKKKNNERFETMFRRFTTLIIRSGKVKDARKGRFHKKNENKTKKKSLRLRKIKVKANNDWLRKTGQLKEDPRRRRGRSR